jgi:hypothetical protein
MTVAVAVGMTIAVAVALVPGLVLALRLPFAPTFAVARALLA